MSNPPLKMKGKLVGRGWYRLVCLLWFISFVVGLFEGADELTSIYLIILVVVTFIAGFAELEFEVAQEKEV